MIYTPFTKDDFKSKTGWNLDNVVPDDQDSAGKSDRFITRVCNLVLSVIEATTPSFDKTNLTTYQNNLINECAIEQADYMILNGDYTVFTGLTQNSGVLASADEIARRYVKPSVLLKLESRIIYRGVGGR